MEQPKDEAPLKEGEVRIKLLGEDEEFDIDVKRFYFPAEIETLCTTCKQVIYRDSEVDYFSYPTINKKIDLDIYCNTCDVATKVSVKLKMTMELA